MNIFRKTTKGKGRTFRTVKEGAGMTEAGVKAYRRANPGSKLHNRGIAESKVISRAG